MKRINIIGAAAATAIAIALAVIFVATSAHAAIPVTPIIAGGSGTSTLPAYGMLFIGGKNGEYEFVASSTLGAVQSIFGRTGAITAQSGDYTTSQVTEGSNLYFTNVRSDARFVIDLAGTTSVTSITALPSLSLPYSQITGTPIIASSTLLGDTNTFSGTNKFSNAITISTLSGLVAANSGLTYAAATSTLTPSSPLTGSFAVVGSGGSIGCQIASGSQAGCLSSADWTTFNNKAGFAFPFTASSSFGNPSNSTSTQIDFKNGLTASSTSYMNALNVTSLATQSVICNFMGMLSVSCFPGGDVGAKNNAAYAALPSTGGILLEPCDTETQNTQVVFNMSSKSVIVEGCGDGSSVWRWTGQATSTKFQTGQNGQLSSGMRDMTITGTTTGASGTDIAPGIDLGGSPAFAYGYFQNVHVNNLGTGWYLGQGVYIVTFEHIFGDFDTRGFVLGPGGNSGEQIAVNNSGFADCRFSAANPYDHCVDLQPTPANGAPSVNFVNVSTDKAQLYVGNEVRFHSTNLHSEIVTNTNAAYIPVVINGDANTKATFEGAAFLDGNDQAHSPACFISTNTNLAVSNSEVGTYGGYTVPAFVCNTGTGNRAYDNVENIAGTGFTVRETSTQLDTNVNYLNGGKIGLGSISEIAAVNASSTWPQGQFSNNTATSGGNVFWGVTTSANGAGGGLLLFSASNSTTAGFLSFILSSGNMGLGTTSPTAKLAVAAKNGDTNLRLFVVASSTAASTTDLFSISNTGAASTTSLFGAQLSACSGSNFLQWSGGLFNCAAGSGSSASTTLLTDTNTFGGTDIFSNTIKVGSLAGLVGASSGTLYAVASSSLFGFTPVNPTRAINTTYPLQGGGDLSADRTLTLAFGTTTANSWSSLQTLSGGMIATASSTFSGSLHANQASTTNFEMTFYMDNPAVDLGTQFNTLYAAAPAGSTFIVAASSTFSVGMNMGTAGKVATIQCSPGVVLTWTGAATSTILNPTDLNNLKAGWGFTGCTLRGTGGAGQVLIQLGGSNGGQGAVLTGLDLGNAGAGLRTEANTWNINVDNSWFGNLKQAVHIESANNSGEGFRFSGDTFADCSANYGDCFFSETNGSDGLTINAPVFDDAGIDLQDGNLNATINSGKWENPNAASIGRYTYGTFGSGGFMQVNINGGTAMNGAADLAHSPNQIFLNGAQLNINGLSLDNNTGGAVTIPALVNNYGGGSVEVLSYKDINVGTVTVGTIATSSITFAIDKGNGLITSYLPFRLYPGGSVPSTAYLGWGEDVGNGATDFFAYNSSAGFFKLMVDANPLVLNGRGGGNVGVGTTSPFAALSVMVGGDYASHPLSTAFAISSTTAGRATTTLVSVDSAGAMTISSRSTSGNPLKIDNNGNSTTDLLLTTSGQTTEFTIQNTGTGGVSWGFISTQNGNGVGGGNLCISTSCGAGTMTNGIIMKANSVTGIGTTSPFAQFSLATPPGATGAVTTLFAIASSTASATTTLFSISNTGTTTLGQFGACSGANALQTSAAGTIQCGAVSSDPRLKNNIVPLSNVSDPFDQVRPISYYWKPEAQRGTAQEYGFNALEVQKAFPQAVETMAPDPSGLTPNGTLEIKLPAMVAILWQKVQDQENLGGGAVTRVVSNAQDVPQYIWLGILTAMFLSYMTYNEWDKRRRR